MGTPAAKSFQATLERGGPRRLGWTIARLPFDAAKLWGIKGLLKVTGEINGFAFRTSLFPDGEGRHYLLVNKQMQSGGKAGCGATARFRLEHDTEQRTVAVPPELAGVFAEDRALRKWYGALNYSTRKNISDWISGVKSADARARRAAQIAERLLETMEAERELPPLLRIAFARDDLAYKGWKRMSPTRRRGHLLGIFYYRDPVSRQRRAAKALEDARRYAGKKPGARSREPE